MSSPPSSAAAGGADEGSSSPVPARSFRLSPLSSPSVRLGANTRGASVLERLDNTIAVEVSRTQNDLEGGGVEGSVVREQYVKVRTGSQGRAMGNMDRKLMQLQGVFQSVRRNIRDLDAVEEGVEDTEVGAPQAGSASFAKKPTCTSAGEVQYRLESRKKITTGWRRFFCAQQAGDISDFATHTCCCDINKWINRYLHWTFRTNFIVLFFSMIVGFVSFTLVYAALIMWSGSNNPQCIASEAFDDSVKYTAHDRFADAYQLSWTTFSTVGYGLIYPETSAGEPDQRGCMGIKILCSSEAFFGVLFSGLCGAILFGKVSRIQSFAQVIFSDPIVVRYGSGTRDCEDDEDDDEEGGDKQNKGDVEAGGKANVSAHRHIHCPILEFRIANRLNNTAGGEIMDATLNCVASIDARHACPDILRTVDTQARGGLKNRKLRRRRQQQQSEQAGSAGRVPRKEKEVLNDDGVQRQSLKSSVVATGSVPFSSITEGKPLASVTPKGSTGSLAATADTHEDESDLEAVVGLALPLRITPHQAMEEDSSNLAPRRIFSKMEIETTSHPFFKRLWLAKHVLNEHSPLLTNKAKKMIQKNRGHWPKELNNCEDIRKSIRFNQILVSLSGTCNVNGASVYAQKIYHFVDIVVGYKFANALFRDKDTGSLRVDLDLINDVQEQDGVDVAEPLEGEAIGDMDEHSV